MSATKQSKIGSKINSGKSEVTVATLIEGMRGQLYRNWTAAGFSEEAIQHSLNVGLTKIFGSTKEGV